MRFLLSFYGDVFTLTDLDHFFSSLIYTFKTGIKYFILDITIMLKADKTLGTSRKLRYLELVL